MFKKKIILSLILSLIILSLIILSNSSQNKECAKARLANKQSWLPSDPAHAQGRHQKSIWAIILLNTTLWQQPPAHQYRPPVWSWANTFFHFFIVGAKVHTRLAKSKNRIPCGIIKIEIFTVELTPCDSCIMNKSGIIAFRVGKQLILWS